MEMLVPLLIGVTLIWLIGRGVPWNAKLLTLVVTLAVDRRDRAGRAQWLLARRLAAALNQSVQATSLSPMIPATIRPMQARRKAVAGSPSRTMPSAAVPTVPMPVQTA